jgi:hypothetical protein
VEIAVLEYVDCFNHRRPNETCGDIPPAELETAYYRQNTALAEAGQTDSNLSLPDSPGRFRPSTNPHHAAYLPPDTAISVWPLADPLLDWEVLT